jgi:cell division septum initiation protein DivIVA
MAAAEQASIAAPGFAVVRRGYDPDQVARHLERIDAETTILAADRAAAVDQAAQLSQQLATCRKELDAARTEVERLRGDLRVLAGPPDTIDSMSERLQVMLRLAKDEFTGMRADVSAQAAAHAAEIIAAVGAEPGDAGGFGFDESELRVPRDEEGIERMRREAVAERTRLDEEAAARRAAADEEFRQVLTLRCREAMAQLAKLQTEALRSARRVMDDADDQARTVLADAREVVRRTVDDAQREVDVLQELRQHLAAQLDTSRQLLGRAVPEARAAAGAGDGDAGATSPSTPNPPGPAAAQQPSDGAPAPAGQYPPVPVPATGQSQGSTPIAAPAFAGVPQLPPSIPSVPAPAHSTPAAAPGAAAASAGEHGPENSGTPRHPTSLPPATRDMAPTGQQRGEQASAPRLSSPEVPALATLPAPQGWQVAPGAFPVGQAGVSEAAHAAPEGGPAPEPAQPRLDDAGPGRPYASDGSRAQPMRIPPRDPESSDVPSPSHIPPDEQDPQIAPPRRYP